MIKIISLSILAGRAPENAVVIDTRPFLTEPFPSSTALTARSKDVRQGVMAQAGATRLVSRVSSLIEDLVLINKDVTVAYVCASGQQVSPALAEALAAFLAIVEPNHLVNVYHRDMRAAPRRPSSPRPACTCGAADRHSCLCSED